MNNITVYVEKVCKIDANMLLGKPYYQAVISDDNYTMTASADTMERAFGLLNPSNIINTIMTNGDEGINDKILQTLGFRNYVYHCYGEKKIALHE